MTAAEPSGLPTAALVVPGLAHDSPQPPPIRRMKRGRRQGGSGEESTAKKRALPSSVGASGGADAQAAQAPGVSGSDTSTDVEMTTSDPVSDDVEMHTTSPEEDAAAAVAVDPDLVDADLTAEQKSRVTALRAPIKPFLLPNGESVLGRPTGPGWPVRFYGTCAAFVGLAGSAADAVRDAEATAARPDAGAAEAEELAEARKIDSKVAAAVTGLQEAIADLATRSNKLLELRAAIGRKRNHATRPAEVAAVAALRTAFIEHDDKIADLYAELFPICSNFSAVGRAHDLGDAVDSGTGHEMGYLKGAEFDDMPTDWHTKFNKSAATSPDAVPAKKPAMAKKWNGKTAEQYEAALATPPKEQKFTRATPKDREGGQLKAMQECSAANFAELAGIDRHDQTRWEWLHVMAASLGGETSPKNLVLGTRDANTHMMVYESHLSQMAAMVGASKKYKKLDAAFKLVASSDARSLPHRVEAIVIEWEVKPGPTPPGGTAAKPLKGKATFDVLDFSANIAKAEVRVMAAQLKEYRTKLDPQSAAVVPAVVAPPTSM
ncbi:hypothetical protein ABFT23_01880 [Nocardioides sp. C4-1]|uniref:hypothetical protein n=1 Tax=Nocardioides sp. C4-1 TaxID=3151851 RepID=UPI0032669F2E